jgi:site-specific recombinase XerD
MLTLFRRHLTNCPQRPLGRKYRRCRCPISVEGTLGGAKVRRALDLTSWEAASEQVRGWEASGSVERPQPTVKDAITKFLADAEARNLREPTLRKHRRTLAGQLLPFLERKGVRLVGWVTLEDLREFRASLTDGALTQAKKVERLRAFFGFCLASGWVARNVAKDLGMPKAQSAPTMPFSDEEMARILKACDDYTDEYKRKGSVESRRLKALLLLMRYSALRIQDAVCLPRAALRKNRIHLRTAKTGVAVQVPVPEFVTAALEDAPVSAEYFLWTGSSKRTSPTGHYQRRLQKLFKLAKIEGGHSHRFRDTMAVSLLQNGVPLETVAAVLGLGEDLREALRALGEEPAGKAGGLREEELVVTWAATT